MDRAIWKQERSNVIDVELLMRAYRLAPGLRIDIAGIDLQHVVSCGPLLTLGIDRDGALASVAALVDIDVHHFRS